MTTEVTRRGQIAAGLEEVTQRIRAACAAAGRDPGKVTLIGITKTFPASDVRLLAELGLLDVGENRDQEAAGKAAELTGLGLRWHFVGQVQSRKARTVAEFADVVHSVDRLKLVTALGRAAGETGRPLRVLIQVRLDVVASADGVRGGADPDDLSELAAAVAATDLLTLGGLMAVAPRGEDPATAFDTLAELSAQLRAAHPDATDISAGMSGDLEAAITAGATHLRVGSALLGGRPPLG